jgi:hypothetical protein
MDTKKHLSFEVSANLLGHTGMATLSYLANQDVAI